MKQIFNWNALIDPFKDSPTQQFIRNNNHSIRTELSTFFKGFFHEYGIFFKKSIKISKQSYNELNDQLQAFSKFRLYEINQESIKEKQQRLQNMYYLMKGAVYQKLIWDCEVIGCEQLVKIYLNEHWKEIIKLIDLKQKQEHKNISIALLQIFFGQKIKFQKVVSGMTTINVIKLLVQKINIQNDQFCYEVLLFLFLSKSNTQHHHINDRFKKSQLEFELLTNRIEMLYLFLQKISSNIDFIRSSTKDNLLFIRIRFIIIQIYYIIRSIKHLKTNKIYNMLLNIYYEILIKIYQCSHKFLSLQYDQIYITRILSSLEFNLNKNYGKSQDLLRNMDFASHENKQQLQLYNIYKLSKFEEYYSRNSKNSILQKICKKWLNDLEWVSSNEQIIFLYFIGKIFQKLQNQSSALQHYWYAIRIFWSLETYKNSSFQTYYYYLKIQRRIKKCNQFKLNLKYFREPHPEKYIRKICCATQIYKNSTQMGEQKNMIDLKFIEKCKIQQIRMLSKEEGSMVIEAKIQGSYCLIRKIYLMSISQYNEIYNKLCKFLTYKGSGISKIFYYNKQQIYKKYNHKQILDQVVSSSTQQGHIDSLDLIVNHNKTQYFNISIISYNTNPSISSLQLNFNQKLYIVRQLVHALQQMFKSNIIPININHKSIKIHQISQNVEIQQFVYNNQPIFIAPQNKDTIRQTIPAAIYSLGITLLYLFFWEEFELINKKGSKQEIKISSRSENLKELKALISNLTDKNPEKRCKISQIVVYFDKLFYQF